MGALENHWILVHVIEPKQSEFEQVQAYRSLIAGDLHSNVLKVEEKKRLAANVWLLERDNDLKILAKIVTLAEARKLECEVRFLSGDSTGRFWACFSN